MQQRSQRRRLIHRQVGTKRRVRRNTYFVTEHKASVPLAFAKP
ncbi:hypothetical protein [Ferrimonas lipolytica]|nr:hypothetical protein [Ferrimonas lipolytica]